MPWSPSDATRFTHKAKTAKQKRAFAHAANSVLSETGNEGRAVRAGNAIVAHMAGKLAWTHNPLTSLAYSNGDGYADRAFDVIPGVYGGKAPGLRTAS